jgi:adenylyl-sulfate kinase
VADVTIRTKAPIALDHADRIAPTGRFVLIDRRQVCGGGMISRAAPAGGLAAPSGLKSRNVFWTAGRISRDAREQRDRQKGAVIWLTGLSGSGKSTLATELERELFAMGLHAYALDGDNLRHGLSADLGFAPEDRREHIRRVAEVGRLFADVGTLAIVALISPYRDDRQRARALVDEGRFIEVHVSASLAVCEERDPKGLYKKARAGEILEFTGVSAPYEPPQRAEIVVDTEHHSVPECVAQILDDLKSRGVLS